MNLGRKAADRVASKRGQLAEATVAAQYARNPHLAARYGDSGRSKCVRDTEYLVSYLAASVAYESPPLFDEYIRWARSVMAAFGLHSEDFHDNLTCLRGVITTELPADVYAAVLPYIDRALTTILQPLTADASYLAEDAPLADVAMDYLSALLKSDRHRAIRSALNAVDQGASLESVYLNVFQRTQREVGRLWQLRQITVAQEHFCTAATQLAIAQLYPRILERSSNGRKLVAAAPAGEFHEVGLRIVTDLFEAQGWDTMYLGANVPAESVAAAIDSYRPQLLLLSVTMAYQLNAAERLIDLVRSSEAGRKLKILIGGYPCNVDGDLWRRIGADGCACDVAEALSLADRLLAESVLDGELRSSAPRAHGNFAFAAPLSIDQMTIFDELSRVNDELQTAHRELVRKNAELERLQMQLKEADRRKDEFLATLSHELRNPLSAIQGSVEMMQMFQSEPEVVTEFQGVVERQAEHALRLVSDLFDLSRIVSGKIVLEKAPVELAAALRAAIETARPAIQARRHRLRYEECERSLEVDGDSTRLTQVFSNLLTNAARYTDPGGEISLTVEAGDDEAVVTVKDNGIGIPPGMTGKIFEPFVQEGRSMEGTQSGLGLGLLLVKRLVELHDGAVEARSQGVGMGSEFIVRLPILER
ncbi:MAG TPA: ATP-binding protein [Pirellulaceae bacterium]|jgi:signal transduction histidine kinase|nr:ATP-binding protein [Pirellulaceae bacterium]